MFEGPIGKKMMIEQGYVPATCTLPVEFAGLLIYSEVSKGRDPCGGCNENRAICNGRPKTDDRLALMRLPTLPPTDDRADAGRRAYLSGENSALPPRE